MPMSTGLSNYSANGLITQNSDYDIGDVKMCE